MNELWGNEEDRLLDKLTDWSKNGMGAVILQAERTPKALEAEKLEKEGAKCQFEGSIKGLWLRPIAFISRKTKEGMEKSMHSYVGEVATLRWGVEKF